MKFTISPEQKRFFDRLQILEVEGILSDQQFSMLKKAVEQTLALRLHIDPLRLNRATAQQLFSAGRDLWRSHPEIKKIAASQAFGNVLYELLDVRPIRLGFDQILPSERAVLPEAAEPSLYADLLRYNTTLEQISSIQGIAGAMIICLEAPSVVQEGWPSVPGSAVFVSSKAILPFSSLRQHQGALYYVAVFCKDRSVYAMNPLDPHTHSLKQAGYNPGDRLNEKFNPTIFR